MSIDNEHEENEQMEIYHKHLLAEEVLRANNMPIYFSYRQAFILGLEKGRELSKPNEL